MCLENNYRVQKYKMIKIKYFLTKYQNLNKSRYFFKIIILLK